MRIFIAIEFNNEIKDHIDKVKYQAKSLTSGGSFTYKDNFHLTLKFIGEVEEKNLADIKAAIKATATGEASFSLFTAELGAFNKKNKNILWIGLKGDLDRLNNLFNKLEASLEEIGINREERGYNPHITIGRQVIIDDFKSLKDKIELKEIEIIVDSISLMESKRENGRLVYKPLISYKLG